MNRSKLWLLLAAAGGAMTAAPALAQTLSYPDFSNTSGLTFAGSTATTTTGDGTVLRIVPASTGQAGAAYSTTAITLGAAASFSTQFSFRFTGAGGIDPADGITFVLAASPTGLGGSGFGIGYNGVPNSVAIEFDTFNNGESGGSNHVGVDDSGILRNNGVSPYGVSTCEFGGLPNYTAPGCMSNGNLWTATIGYDGSTQLLNVSVFDSAIGTAYNVLTNYSIDIAGFLGTNTAYVGFTGATGSGFENEDIVSWRFSNTAVLPPEGGVPEPGTWAMMLAGFGLMGGAIRRRAGARATLA